MKLIFRKLQTSSESLTVEFGNRTETYAKDQFDDLLENGIEFEETDLGDKDINGIKIKTTVDGLEKIKDFKKGIEFYVEGSNILHNVATVRGCRYLIDTSSLTKSHYANPIYVPNYGDDNKIMIKATYGNGSIIELVGKCNGDSSHSWIEWKTDSRDYFTCLTGARSIDNYDIRALTYNNVPYYTTDAPINIEFSYVEE